MESPETCVTNVLKIENLPRIPYTIYRRISRRLNPSDTAPSRLASFHIKTNILREAERTLRANNVLALADLTRSELWVFRIDLKSESKDLQGHVAVKEIALATQEEGADEKWKKLEKQLADNWRLREFSSGVFLASSLAGPPPPPTTNSQKSTSSTGDTHSTPAHLNHFSNTHVTPGLGGPNAEIISETTATIDLTDDETGEGKEADQCLPYKQFVTAILNSFSFNLALNHGYTPLNIRTLVSPSSLVPATNIPRREPKQDNEQTKRKLLSSAPVVMPQLVKPDLLALEVYLTTSGTLLVTPHTETQSAIRRVSSSSFPTSDLEKREVYIAPWGEWGRMTTQSPPPSEEKENQEKEASATVERQIKKWKDTVRSFLQDHGILSSREGRGGGDGDKSVLEKAIDEGEWAWVEIWVSSILKPGMGRIVKILWPTALLFLRSSENDRYSALPTSPPQILTQPPISETNPPLQPPPSLPPLADSSDEEPSFWKKVFDDKEYSALATGRLSLSLASLVFVPEEKSNIGPKNLGVEWWGIPSSLDWAESWVQGKEDRENQIKSRREEKKKREEEEAMKRDKQQQEEEEEERQGGDEGEAVNGMEQEQEQQLLKVNEEEKGKQKILDEGKKEIAQGGGGGGVYPTPPDAVLGQQIQGPGSTTSISAPNTTATVSTAATTVGTDIDLLDDWMGGDTVGDAPPVELERKQGESLAIPVGQLPQASGESDLFGDMDEEMEMFGEGMGVTEDDFNFFDEPDMGGFGGDIDGDGEDVDMGLGDGMALDVEGIGGVDMGVGGGVDITMETPVPERPAENIAMESNTAAPQSATEASAAEPTLREKPPDEPHIQTPPLSPQRAIKLLVPEYSNPSSQPNPTPPTTAGATMKTPIPQSHSVPPHPGSSLRELKRRVSLYSPIVFTTNVEMADRKYAPGGRFFLPESMKEKDEKEQEKRGVLASPKVTTLKRKRCMLITPKAIEESPPAAPEVADVTLEDEDAVMESAGSENGASSDSGGGGWTEESSSESDADDETEEEDEVAVSAQYNSPLTNITSALAMTDIGRKRKRPAEDDGEVAMTETLKQQQQQQQDAKVGTDDDDVGELAPLPWHMMKSDPADYGLVGVFSNMKLETDATCLGTLGEAEFAAVSKILADQIMFGTLEPLRTGSGLETGIEDDDEEESFVQRRKEKDQNAVEEVVKGVFSRTGVVRCDLETYTAVTDTLIEQLPSAGGRTTMRPIAVPRRGGGGTTAMKSSHEGQRSSSSSSPPSTTPVVFKIPPPSIHLHRADTALEILPPALHFWETFGFGPCSGAKNIISFCIHPTSKSMEEAADAFLERISGSYEGGRFGSHFRAKLEGVVEAGLFGIDIPKAGQRNHETTIKAYSEGIIGFGAILANVADQLQNVMVYIVNPFEHPSAVVDICAAFMRLKQVYNKTMEDFKGMKKNNLVLQIVPAGFVAAKMGMIARGMPEFGKLAMEVYNRCITTDGVENLEKAQKTFSPPLFLARPPPKNIEFKLSPETPASVLHENSVLHVAYAQSIDERWVSVAWADNWGEIQATESYCLGRKGTNALRVFEEVCQTIWNATVKIIKSRKVHWRLMFVKAGIILPDEIDIWTRLSLSAAFTTPNTLTLISASTSPALKLTPQLPPINPASFNPTMTLYTTPPVTTPQTVSPDQFGNAVNTPSSVDTGLPDMDPDSNLMDYTDETWGVILSHRVPHSESLLDSRRSLNAGYLIRRSGIEDSDTVAIIGVDVVYSAQQRGGRKLLVEVLEWYRDLVTLGEARGVMERGKAVVPWHVWVVGKAVGGLGEVM